MQFVKIQFNDVNVKYWHKLLSSSRTQFLFKFFYRQPFMFHLLGKYKLRNKPLTARPIQTRLVLKTNRNDEVGFQMHFITSRWIRIADKAACSRTVLAIVLGIWSTNCFELLSGRSKSKLIGLWRSGFKQRDLIYFESALN